MVIAVYIRYWVAHERLLTETCDRSVSIEELSRAVSGMVTAEGMVGLAGLESATDPSLLKS